MTQLRQCARDSYLVLSLSLAMIPKISNINFPVWQYLTQSLFDEHYPAIISPRLYWHVYQVRHLEKCLLTNHLPRGRFQS
jgi:hypothetical protein